MVEKQGQTGTEEAKPVTFTCYRVNPGEGVPEEGMNTYSVTVILPDGDVRHQIVWARDPDDVGDAIRVPPGTRVIMTQMANSFVWDSEPVEQEGMEEEVAPAT
jgi:hypothetical protein